MLKNQVLLDASIICPVPSGHRASSIFLEALPRNNVADCWVKSSFSSKDSTQAGSRNPS